MESQRSVKVPLDYIELVDRRVNELDRRRDVNLISKLEAIEKLFNMTLSVKSEALSIAISRAQGDGRDCLKRCSVQVKEFHDLLDIKAEKITRLEMFKEAMVLDFVKYEEDFKAFQKETEEILDRLNSWKDGFWVKHIISAIVVTVATSQLVLFIFTWVIDFFSKIKG